MAQAPAHVSSHISAPNAPEKGKGLSYIKEKTKAELFEAISNQNVLHGGRQKNVEDRYKQKVEKMKERGNDEKKAQQIATKQIQKVWAKVWKDKLATPGTKGSGDFYKNIGDSDGEGAIFLMKKFIFGKKQSFTTYLKHEEIENYAQSSDLNNEKVLKIFLDGGGVPGVTVTSDEGKGLRSAWKKSRMVMDHHPEGPTSTTGMVTTLFELTNLIPESEKKTVKKFAQTIDIVDSFLSKAGRAIHVEKDYAKTLCSLSYLLDSEELYKVCEKLPDNIGPLSPIPEDLLGSIEVTPKGKDTKVKLSECVAKKQINVDAGVTMLKEKLTAKQFVTIEGKKFLIFGPKDNISNDVRALLSAEHDYGTIKVHPGGEVFMVHDNGIPATIRELGLTVRDVIFLLNPKTAKTNHQDDLKKLCNILPASDGKKYMLGLLGIEENPSLPVVTPGIIPETIPTPTPVTLKPAPAVIPEKVISPTPVITAPVEQKKQPLKKIFPHPFPVNEIQTDMKNFGKDAGLAWSSFINAFRKKKK